MPRKAKPAAPFWRAAHGAAAKSGAIVVNESLPADELPSATPPNTDRADRGPDGRFLPGNRTATAKRIRPGPQGALVALEARADPYWQAANRWSKQYSSHRRAELTSLHGGELSAGVSAMIESASHALGDARYLRAKAAETGDPEMLKTAASLAKDARQAERDAWALAAHEAAARPKKAADYPWLIQPKKEPK
jgi:hypothetical protein